MERIRCLIIVNVIRSSVPCFSLRLFVARPVRLFSWWFLLLFCRCTMFIRSSVTCFIPTAISRLWFAVLAFLSSVILAVFSHALSLLLLFPVVFYVLLHLLTMRSWRSRRFIFRPVRLSPFALSVWQTWPAVPAETLLRIVIPNFIHGIILVMYLLNILIPESSCDCSSVVCHLDFSSTFDGKLFNAEKRQICGSLFPTRAKQVTKFIATSYFLKKVRIGRYSELRVKS